MDIVASIPKVSRKRIVIILAIIILALASATGFIYYGNYKKIRESALKEELVKKQMENLDNLHRERKTQPLTEEEAKKQIQEMLDLSKQATPKPITQDDINKQLEELKNLGQ